LSVINVVCDVTIYMLTVSHNGMASVKLKSFSKLTVVYVGYHSGTALQLPMLAG